MELDAAGVPVCCSADSYKDYMSPFDRPAVTKEAPTLKATVGKTNADKTLQKEMTGEQTNSNFTKAAQSVKAVGVQPDEPEDEGQSSTTPSSQQPEDPVKDGQKSIKNEMEIVCEEGFIWYPDKRLCIQTRSKCPRGMYMSVRQNLCIPKDNLPFKCPPGYEYKDDKGDCLDVDECTEGIYQNNMYVAACPNATQICRNTPGSFECVCKPGYTFSRDGECIGK
ncbi:unnamed protein product [Dibothriocephalus latus]|uniref:EGF-like calcium-binding domain-containing protein n=1 Tax=Dibothriocephalus latus TaxID=60516 RepID=A0A3P7LVL5_DIBLA|nr:unnamed protein product [Dibothriocephalus latus]